MIQFRALSSCKPLRNGEMPVLHMNLCFFSQLCLKKYLPKLTDVYVKNLYNMNR
jgi:hypothetical protein